MEIETGAAVVVEESAPYFPQKRGESISLRFDSDGNLLPSTRETTKQKLRDALKKKQVREALGIERDKLPEVVDAPFCGKLWELVSQIEASLSTLITKMPQDRAKELWRFSPEEQAMLAETTAGVINAHAPSWLTEDPTLVRFVAVVAMTHAPRVAQTVTESRKKKSSSEEKSPATEGTAPGPDGRSATTETPNMESFFASGVSPSEPVA